MVIQSAGASPVRQPGANIAKTQTTGPATATTRSDQNSASRTGGRRNGKMAAGTSDIKAATASVVVNNMAAY